ncbi:MAG: hydrolase [Geminicoccaceae bacterium]
MLLLVDLQSKLAPAIDQIDACIGNCAMLLAAARRLDLPVLATEQYPAGIGPTVSRLRDHLGAEEIVEKIHFDGSAETDFLGRLEDYSRPTIVIGGTEAHVCVLQTALGLKGRGFEPVLVADAVSSRTPQSKDLAIDRLRSYGIEIVSTEMVIFEWLRVAGTPAFKALLPLIKSGPYANTQKPAQND